MPEITNPRALLAEIRETFDRMMDGGEIHTTPTGVRINLRGLLGVCDQLLPFVCRERQPSPFDWAELKALRLRAREQKDQIEELQKRLQAWEEPWNCEKRPSP